VARREGHKFADMAACVQGGRDLGPAFAEDARQALGRKAVQRIAHVRAALCVGRARHEAQAKVGQRGRDGCRFGMDQPDRRLPCAAGKAAVGPQAQPAVEHDAQGLAGDAQVAHGQVGIVGQRGADAHHHRVMAGAQGMDARARLRAGDPFRHPGRIGDAPVDRQGQLERDMGHPGQDAAQEAFVQHLGFGTQDAFGDGRAARAQDRVAPPGDPGVGIGRRGDDARKARCHQRVRRRVGCGRDARRVPA
jgi:hypothetical protein